MRTINESNPSVCVNGIFVNRDREFTKKSIHDYNMRNDVPPKISFFSSKNTEHPKVGDYKIERIIRIIKSPDSDLAFLKEKGSRNFFTWSGKFASYRHVEDLIYPSGLLCITIKNYTEEHNFQTAFFKNDPYTYVLFKNYITNDLHIVVKVDANSVNEHEQCYFQLINYFSCMYSVEINQFDDGCKYVTSLCHLSHDPLVYFKRDSSRFKVIFNSGYNHNELPVSTTVKRLTKSHLDQLKLESLVVDMLITSKLEKHLVVEKLMKELERGVRTIRDRLSSLLKKKTIKFNNIEYKFLESKDGKKNFYLLTAID